MYFFLKAFVETTHSLSSSDWKLKKVGFAGFKTEFNFCPNISDIEVLLYKAKR